MIADVTNNKYGSKYQPKSLPDSSEIATSVIIVTLSETRHEV